MVACASDQSAKLLDETLRSYSGTVRWADFKSALEFVHPDQRPEPGRLSFLLSRFEQVKVTGYDTPGPVSTGQEFQVAQNVEIRIANIHTAHERTINVTEIWEWDEDDKRWWLMSGLPDISR